MTNERDLLKKAYEDIDVSLDDYQPTISDTSAMTAGTSQSTALDAQGNELQIGDLVDSLRDSAKSHGVVTGLGTIITVEWDDMAPEEEQAIDLVLTDIDKEPDDECSDETPAEAEDDECSDKASAETEDQES